MVFFESAFFFETVIKAFERRKDVEILAGPGGFVKYGIVVFEVKVEWLVDSAEVVGIKNE